MMIKLRLNRVIRYSLILMFASVAVLSCENEQVSKKDAFGPRPTQEVIGADHIMWNVKAVKVADNEYDVLVHAWLEDKWHLYSQVIEMEDGPLATLVTFDNDKSKFELLGEAEEIGVEKHYDTVWEHDIAFFAGEVLFKQKVKLTGSDSSIFNGNINFMMCDDKECMPPEDFTFRVDLKTGDEIIIEGSNRNRDRILSIIPEVKNVDLKNPINDCGDEKEEEDKSYWVLFLLGLGGGLISLITPCVFPMIPLTVSFFTKGGKETGKGVGRAVLYGLSIIAVYVLLSLPFYAPGTDPEMLNKVATSVGLNIFFFLVFVVFAISFFGYYEITLPSSWANKADKASDIGGVLGIVFMALVLAIVSFSCTGPLLGSVLAGSLKDGPVPITIAMLGFGVGLGLPFTIFAAFPSLLKSLPSSGGWLNTVKVVLGFVELGLAVKFLSNADFVFRAGIIHRETFFLIWAILAFATAAYLFGLFRFPHDQKGAKISGGRKVIGIIFLVFGIYTAPGVLPVQSQPWTYGLVSGFPPSTWYSWYDQKEDLHIVTDFNEAVAISQKENKPILIDFTGYACVNCRKMEDNVWTKKNIHSLLDTTYVIASLYVDDKVELAEEDQGEIFTSLSDGTEKLKKIRTVGDIWSTFESLRFNQVSQPYYVLLSPDGKLLTNPIAYTPDSDEYYEWLKCGVDAFNKSKQ